MTKHIFDYSHSKRCDQCGKEFYRDKRCTWKWWGKARFCSRSCSARAGVAKMREAIPDIAAAFYAKAISGDANDCWQWRGVSDKDGYALLTFDAKQHRASRVAVQITGRAFGEGEQACHSCGNAWCVNPAHIYPGSPKQNNLDKKAHGTHLVGEQVGNAKLTEDVVRQIRLSNLSSAKLAKRFGVSSGAVFLARTGKTWKHVQ